MIIISFIIITVSLSLSLYYPPQKKNINRNHSAKKKQLIIQMNSLQLMLLIECLLSFRIVFILFLKERRKERREEKKGERTKEEREQRKRENKGERTREKRTKEERRDQKFTFVSLKNYYFSTKKKHV